MPQAKVSEHEASRSHTCLGLRALYYQVFNAEFVSVLACKEHAVGHCIKKTEI